MNEIITFYQNSISYFSKTERFITFVNIEIYILALRIMFKA